MEHATAIRRLDLAQAEPKTARGRRAADDVVMHVWDRYRYRILSYYSNDPAMDRDDIAQTYLAAVWRGIWEDRQLGNRIFFLGQCGWYAVQSAIRSHQRHVPPVEEQFDVMRHDIDHTAEPVAMDGESDIEAMVVEHIYAEGVVRVLADSALEGTQRRCYETLLDGGAGDPGSIGFNKRLAQILGVTPQRASQIINKLRDKAIAGGA